MVGDGDSPENSRPRRRVRYRGTHPRKFKEKYKELDPERDPETIAKVLASGKTPAGQHRPILVSEILVQLKLQATSARVADVTLAKCGVDKLARALWDGADEPHAELLARAIVEAQDAGKPLDTTRQLRRVVESALPGSLDEEEMKATVTRVFQGIRIAVNEEFSALDAFLDSLPGCLRSGGRVVILSFHSGEDRRVKHHFRDGFRNGIYGEIAQEVIRPSYEEVTGNSRAASAKMRWAVKGAF